MSATIDSSEFILRDNWPTMGQGWTPPKSRDPANGGGHNVESNAYTLGVTWDIYQEGATGINRGWSRFTYLKVGTQSAIAAKSICCLDTAPGAATGVETLYTVTDLAAGSPVEDCGLCAVAISAMTDGYYGWFWTGGVCPESIISGMAGDYLTDGNVIVGGMDCATAAAGTVLGFGLADSGAACGISFVVDVA
jgi:hypothetical protein